MNKLKKKNNKKDEVIEVTVMQPIKTRHEILDILSQAIEKQHQKVTKGKIFNPENEKIRVSQWKSLVHSCQVYNQVLKDMELNNLQYELQQIQNAIIDETKTNEELQADIDKVTQTMKILDDHVDISDID